MRPAQIAPLSSGARSVDRLRWTLGEAKRGVRVIADETPVALTYDASTFAVMMATPRDLEDFALGFSLTETIVSDPSEIAALEIIDGDLGVEVRMWLSGPAAEALSARRRRIAGPTGCGLCGIDSLAEAVRTPPRITAQTRFRPEQVLRAMASLAPAQALHELTHAVHAAAFWRPRDGLVALREDVGRHNALDKLAGTLARQGALTQDGAVLLTSRVSVEMVQKAAAVGAPLLAAVSAPTALAVKTAELAGVTLVAIARPDGFEVFTCPERIEGL